VQTWQMKLRLARNCRWLFVGASIILSGCVVGGGPCLWLQVKHTFRGQLHFREFPGKGGIDTVAILALDKTEYVYAPPQSFQCLAANDVQLVGVSEFPRDVGENSHIIVEGELLQGVEDGQHTRLVIKVISVAPVKPAQ
jgi:hypothetical protein